MTKKTKQYFNKTFKLIGNIWVLLFVLASLALFLILSLSNVIDVAHDGQNKLFEVIQQGHQLSKYSDFLTSEARNFSVTGDPNNLRAYWQEVNVYKHRDYAVARLKMLSDNKAQVALLMESKRNSDALIRTEVRSMKLVLSAYHIPVSLMPAAVGKYALSKQDLKLSAQKKLQLAQGIMFNDQYYLDKSRIMGPIAKFNNILRAQAKHKYTSNREKLSLNLLILRIDIICILFLVLIIIWLRRGLNLKG